MNIEVTGDNSGVINSQSHNMIFQKHLSPNNDNSDKLKIGLVDEVHDDLFSFLNQLGMISTSGLLVIPAGQHYFYDAEDLKGVQTVINLRQLNYVREIRNFLQTIASLLPHKSKFVGCFVDNKSQNGFPDKYNNLPRQLSEKLEAYENGIESRIPFINRMYSFIDSRTNRYLTKRTVSHLLEECGLQLVSMTELNGLTYFCTEKIKPAA